MKNLLTCLSVFAAFNLSAQIVYPYNPDANGDTYITAPDLLEFLPVFSQPFQAQGIYVNGVLLDSVLIQLQDDVQQLISDHESQFASQQMLIDSLYMVLELQSNLLSRDSIVDIAVGVAYRGELEGVHFHSANLSHANLRNSNLSGADLSNSNLYQTQLENSNLTSANLSGADLDLTYLSSANLSNANLAGADLTRAYLQNANLTGANLLGAWMTCLQGGCPTSLPSGYICEPDPDCYWSPAYRIVPE